MNADYLDTDWFEALSEYVKDNGKTAAARALGYNNHTGVSLMLKGTYPGKTAQFAQRVRAKLMSRNCEATGNRLSIDECKEFGGGPAPTWNPIKMTQWKKCQQCLFNPNKGEK